MSPLAFSLQRWPARLLVVPREGELSVSVSLAEQSLSTAPSCGGKVLVGTARFARALCVEPSGVAGVRGGKLQTAVKADEVVQEVLVPTADPTEEEKPPNGCDSGWVVRVTFVPTVDQEERRRLPTVDQERSDSQRWIRRRGEDSQRLIRRRGEDSQRLIRRRGEDSQRWIRRRGVTPNG